MRLLIAGVPRAGKTTQAEHLRWRGDQLLDERCGPDGLARSGTPGVVLHTDDLIGKLDWSSASAQVATWFDAPGSWIIEGVAIPRALRKWLATHHSGTPADEIRWLGTPRVPLTNGQAIMAKACETVWDEVRPELERRGVVIRFG